MKISIVGCGRVGTTAAYAIMLKGLASEIVLVDVNQEKAKGEELDLIHGTGQLPNVNIVSGDYSMIKDSNVVIVTAGIPRKPGETRLDLAAKNIDVISDICKQILKYSPNSFLFMVSNPVDVMTHVAQKVYGEKKDRVLGLGNVLDQLRFRSLIGKEIKVHPEKVQAMIVGEHGDSMVILEDSIKVNGLPLQKYKDINTEKMEEIIEGTKFGGAKVISRKGGTYYSVAIAICQVLEAIANDTREILPVCYPQKYNGRDVTFSYPAVVGKDGIIDTVELELSTHKQKLLDKSVSAIAQMIDDLNL